MEGLHDLATPGSVAVLMVIRPGRRYGGMGDGTHVRIDERELLQPAARDALCTPDEYREIVARQDKRRAAQSEPRISLVGQSIKRQLQEMWARARNSLPAPGAER